MRRRLLPFLMITLLSVTPLARAQETATENVQFQIRIQPVFVVETDSEQAGSIQLKTLGVEGVRVSDTARIRVHTNEGKRYRIVQRLEQDPLSERGGQLPEEQLQFSVGEGLHGGQSEVKNPVPLTRDSAVLFSSNEQGDADEFTISYFTAGRELLPAGHYRARILIEEEPR